jgi:tetratricopeptide (TPR) repeat protein
MHRMRIFLLCLPLSAVLPLAAQTNPHQQLYNAANLGAQGHYQEAIALAEPVLNSDSAQLSDTERGRGWRLLGLGYQFEGDFEKATTAYENALRILEARKENADDYTAVLSDFGTLYRDMRQYDAATQLEMRALGGNQQAGDHEGAAIASVNLADIEMNLNHTRKARAWMDEAVRESKLAPALSRNFEAFLVSSQASIADQTGDTRAAIAGHRREIDLLREATPEASPTLGWAYMLLGKAYLDDGNVGDALSNMSKGSAMLRETSGAESPHYLIAQIAYARALDAAGTRAQALKIRADAEAKLKTYYQDQCPQCRVTALALH